MKFFRYRHPSLKTLLGVTKAKKRLKKELGITDALKPFRAWTNAKRRLKRKIGYESEGGRLIRDGLPKPGGCLVVVLLVVAVAVAAGVLARQMRWRAHWEGIRDQESEQDRRCEMQAAVDLPKAFSVRDEHEFFPIQHLMGRLNPKFMVQQVATGRHVNGGYTVYWGIVYFDGQPLTPKDVEAALTEAGFDTAHNAPIPTPHFLLQESKRESQTPARRG